MKGTELVLKALKDKGVKYIFGYTGGAIMPIFDEMEKQKCFKFIMSRHEQGAAFMAQGISRGSVGTSHPRTGVCMATSGPGAMNLVTAIADAIMDSVPLLAVTGQVPTGVIATDAFQESDGIQAISSAATAVSASTDFSSCDESLSFADRAAKRRRLDGRIPASIMTTTTVGC